ncbi:MAG: pilin, partial [Candidatus Altiarchaeota archaeon]|nr:pilin [Candidatus Altiarchaeota archaeon]
MKEKTIILILLILLATAGAKGPEEVKAEWNQIICIVLRLIQFVAAGIAALVIILAGVKFMASENLEERGDAKRMLIQVVFGLIIIIIAVQLVNYLVTGSRVERFSLSACDYAPTTTTTIAGTTTTTTPGATTTTVPGATTTTTPSPSTTTTTTSSTTTSTIPGTDPVLC